MQSSLQPAYILHSRPYRDSSALLEVFTAEQGRISLVARGARRRRRGGSPGALLQLFSPLLLSFSGRSEMKNLIATEAAGLPIHLRGDRLFSGMYLNELLVRLLHRHDPHPQIFAAYSQALLSLVDTDDLDAVLRPFEYLLLDELGYGLSLTVEGHSAEPIRAECWYHFHSEFGLVRCACPGSATQPVFSGNDLLAMAAGQWSDAVRLPARRLLRLALACYLGEEPLHSRALFRGVGSSSARSESASGGDRT